MAKTIALSESFIIIKTLNLSGKLFSRFFFSILTLFLLSLLTVSVWQVNEYSRNIFLLQNYDQKMNAMSKENKILEVNFNKSNSLKNFVNYIESQPFEKAVKIDYILVLDRKAVSKAK